MPLAVDATGDTIVLAGLTTAAAAWRDPLVNAELRLALEEDLAAKARATGRELRDDRGIQLVWLKRHRWTDQESGRPREWLEHVPARDADDVEVLVTARAYRP